MQKLTGFKGFIPYLSVVFLNAFVDLGHKIIIQNTVFKTYDGNEQVVLTAVVNALILLPFILLFSPAGFLSDRFPKHQVMRAGAWAVVGATLLITFCYYQGWFWGAFGLTLLLAIQSAIYSPAKYGYIKELVGNEPLARANGVVNAVSILGILLGTFVFSALFEWLLLDTQAVESHTIVATLAPLGWLLVALAIVELVLAYRLSPKGQGRPDKHFEFSRYVQLQYLRRNLGILQRRPAIWLSIVGLATFWAIAQVVVAAFPAFAKDTLGETNTLVIQGILACTGIGIVLGSILAGRLSRNYIETGLIPVGALGLTVALFLMPGLTSPFALALCFLTIGAAGGLFIVPLNALIQFHALPKQLGTVLAGNNWVQNITMLSFLGLTVWVATLNYSAGWLLGAMGVVALLGAGYTLFKLPHAFVRLLVSFLFKGRYRINVVDFKNLPAEGAVLLLGNHISWIDWALVQIACPRPVRFVMQKQIYHNPFIRPFVKLFGVIPIAKGHSEEALAEVHTHLQAGEVVCLFPEGAISRNGQLGKFHTGYQRATQGLQEGVIVPFYLHGLWGSKFSRSSERLRETRAPEGRRRDLIVAFGAPLPINTDAKTLKLKVFELAAHAWQAHSDAYKSTAVALIQSAQRQGAAAAVLGERGEVVSYRALLAGALQLAKFLKGQGLHGRPVYVATGPGKAFILAHMGAWLAGAVVQLSPEGATALVSESPARAPALDAASGAGSGAVRQLVIPNTTAGAPLTRFATWLPASLLARWYGKPLELDAPALQLAAGTQPITHRQLQLNSRQLSDVLNTSASDVVGGFVSRQNAFELMCCTIMPLLEGLPVVHHYAADASLTIAKQVARRNVSLMVLSPSVLAAMACDDTIEPLMLASLRMVLGEHTGEAMAQAEAFESRFNQPVYLGLGGAPWVPVATLNVPDALDTTYWRIQRGCDRSSVGMPLPGLSVAVLDDQGAVVAGFNQEGDLYLGLGLPAVSAGRPLPEAGAGLLPLGCRGQLTEEGFVVPAGKVA
ncbi:MFS transporter [Simiduia sp. 21SJ11W-1]|uniref:MFS transporter n=1 Tax=Simiduia sp. 21SJ11W-1 TaxID=2909669 RepID=UPI00209DD6DA|nr:MFS transporter [Simiduia sp. 21SJ11W-1]UTA46771.1 MFS transporter [Simiduia sp. 21SJ11W-1]